MKSLLTQTMIANSNRFQCILAEAWLPTHQKSLQAYVIPYIDNIHFAYETKPPLSIDFKCTVVYL